MEAEDGIGIARVLSATVQPGSATSFKHVVKGGLRSSDVTGAVVLFSRVAGLHRGQKQQRQRADNDLCGSVLREIRDLFEENLHTTLDSFRGVRKRSYLTERPLGEIAGCVATSRRLGDW